MPNCEICGGFFKTAQGLAGHRRLRHATGTRAGEAGATLTSRQLQRKVLDRLSEKLADRLAESILETHGQEIWEAYLAELSGQGLDLGSLVGRRRMKAIILAAGEHNSLLPLTADKPECLLEVGEKTMLSRELENLRACGVHEIVVVRGYQGDKINFPDIRYYENRDYRDTGILRSLFCARGEMDNDFILSYSDILYTKETLESLLRDESDICLVVDTDWAKHYRNRRQHPVSEAELVRVEGANVVEIGRDVVPPRQAHGEFIGLAKFSSRGAETLRTVHDWAIQSYKNRRFHTSATIDQAYFTDLIQELVDQGYPVRHVDIQGGWAEIDTVEDFERVSTGLNSILKTS